MKTHSLLHYPVRMRAQQTPVRWVSEHPVLSCRRATQASVLTVTDPFRLAIRRHLFWRIKKTSLLDSCSSLSILRRLSSVSRLWQPPAHAHPIKTMALTNPLACSDIVLVRAGSKRFDKERCLDPTVYHPKMQFRPSCSEGNEGTSCKSISVFSTCSTRSNKHISKKRSPSSLIIVIN